MAANEDCNDSDYEDEESLLLVELSGIMEADLLSQVKECNVLGIDTEKPLLQLEHYIFQGEYEDAMGTCMLFEDKSVSDAAEYDDEHPKELEFQHLTNKKLCMQRVFIKKAAEDVDPSSTAGDKQSAVVEEGDNSADVTSQPETRFEVSQVIPGNSTTSVSKIDIPQTVSSSLCSTDSSGTDSIPETLQTASSSIPVTDAFQPNTCSVPDISSVNSHIFDEEKVTKMDTEDSFPTEQITSSELISDSSEVQNVQKHSDFDRRSSDPPDV